MKLLALGHSSYLLEMDSPTGSPVRVLADPWLSDHLIGDLQGRFPRVRIDLDTLGPIDAVFLSHSHTDHCDPYSLVDLWRRLDPVPVLFLPQSMRYLESLFKAHLEGARILVLEDESSIDFHGVKITALFNPETRATNEDDVMLLIVDSGNELFVSEADATLPFYDADVRENLGARLLEKSPQTIVFFAIKNQGESAMSMLDARSSEDRRHRLSREIESTYDEIESLYTPFEGLETDIWGIRRLVRLLGGQGICFPQQLQKGWNRILFPIRLEDRMRMEREVSERNELSHSIEEFVPGMTHVISNGELERREPCEALTLLDSEDDRRFDPNIELMEEVFPVAPLRDEARDLAAQETRILEALNTRFLPWWIGARTPPVEHVLASRGGEYRIRIRYGSTLEHEDADYRFGFDNNRFEREEPGEADPDEHYWGNDIEDVLDGEADEFSLFCRTPLGGHAQRFWRALGLPYLNADLIERKLRRHFERASRDEPLEDWVLSFYA